jgi:probable rRNA maturation factor
VAKRPQILIAAPVGAEHVKFLRGCLTAAWRLLDAAGEHPPGTLSVAIVEDEAMARLHEDFLSIAGPTDVLTFELEHRPDGSVDEGEVVICLDEAGRQAKERGHRVEEELLLYALHGLLHLCGYDDRDPRAHDAIHAREDELLEAIGVGRRFQP